MQKRRRMLSLLAPIALAALAFLPTGCSTYTPYSFGEHWENRVHVWGRDFMKIGWSFDRHFLNYDWDDPSLD